MDRGAWRAYSPWGGKALDTTERLTHTHTHNHESVLQILDFPLIFFIFYLKEALLIPGIPGSSDGEESTCNEGDSGLIPGLGRSPGEGNSYPLQYSGLENSMNCMIHGVTKGQTQLSNFHFAIP